MIPQRPRRVLSLALLAGLALVPPGAALGQNDLVAERQEGFKRMGAHSRAIKAVLDEGGNLANVAAQAGDMQRFFQRLPTLFPENAKGGKAAPAVWLDRAGFEAAAGNAASAASQLVSAAGSGDATATSNAFRALGGSCGACHRGYRER